MNSTDRAALCISPSDIQQLNKLSTRETNCFWISGISLILVSFPTTAMNLILMISITRTKVLESSSMLLLFSMAGTDFLTGCLADSIVGSYFIMFARGKLVCALQYAVRVIAIPLYLLVMLMVCSVSAERYLAIFHSFFHRRHITKRKVSWFIIIVWILTFLVVLVFVFYGKSGEAISELSLWVLIIAILWNTYVYLRVFIVVKKIRRRIEVENRPAIAQDSVEVRLNKNKRLILFTTVVIGILLVFYGPSLVFRIVRSRVMNQIDKNIWSCLTNSFFYLKSLFSPIFLCWQYPELRTAVMKTLKRK